MRVSDLGGFRCLKEDRFGCVRVRVSESECLKARVMSEAKF